MVIVPNETWMSLDVDGPWCTSEHALNLLHGAAVLAGGPLTILSPWDSHKARYALALGGCAGVLEINAKNVNEGGAAVISLRLPRRARQAGDDLIKDIAEVIERLTPAVLVEEEEEDDLPF